MYYERITIISLVHIHHLKINKQKIVHHLIQFQLSILVMRIFKIYSQQFSNKENSTVSYSHHLEHFIPRNYLITRRFSKNVSSFGFQLSDDFSSIISHNGVKVTSPGNMYLFKKQRQKNPPVIPEVYSRSL